MEIPDMPQIRVRWVRRVARKNSMSSSTCGFVPNSELSSFSKDLEGLGAGLVGEPHGGRILRTGHEASLPTKGSSDPRFGQ
jgi:hypothetical protein